MRPINYYYFKAFYEWACDHDLTPHVLAMVKEGVVVPDKYTTEHMINTKHETIKTIELNISPKSINNYNISVDGISFSARFKGEIHDIFLTFDSLMMSTTREYPQHMFEFIQDDIDESEKLTKTDEKKQKKSSHLTLVVDNEG